MTPEERPESVEEAGALLGAAITVCGSGAALLNTPPKGVHSSFATVSSLPSSKLLVRLYHLRSLLQASPTQKPLVAAPSLLAVLMKLLSTSTQLAAKIATTSDQARPRDETPPMLSNPIRKMWVDCVVLCHRLGEGLSGGPRTSIFGFLKSMIALANVNPRSAKAGGGARIAALDVVAGLFWERTLAPKLVGWAHDVLQLCLRALRSSGNGEPSFRISAVKMSCAVATACRLSQLKLKPVEGDMSRALLLPGAMEGRAVVEAVKVLRQSSADKFPEVRHVGSTLAALLAPMLVLQSKAKPGTMAREEAPNAPHVSLDETINIALKNVDDEMAHVAMGWSEALARCLCTAVELGQRKADSAMAKRDVEVDQDDPNPFGNTEANAQRNARRKDGPVVLCGSIRSAICFLIRWFVRSGGEFSAARAGGSFSVGGRAVRVGFSNALIHLLRIQSAMGKIGDNTISMSECVHLVLKMAGEEAEKGFAKPSSTHTLDVTTMSLSEPKPAPANSLFGVKKSSADAGLVRLATGNVLRLGIAELASENMQLSLLQCLLELLCPPSPSASSEKSSLRCNAHQLQVLLVEVSHLLTALGEAAANKVGSLSASLKTCLGHKEHGVRYEAAVACGALAESFPVVGRMMVATGLEDIKKEYGDILETAKRGGQEADDLKRSFGRMFRRAKKESEKAVDPTLIHQYRLHGLSLMIGIVASDLPQIAGGISQNLLRDLLDVANGLAAGQFNDILTTASPSMACTCVRAGFEIVAGLLSIGPIAVEPYTMMIFDLFQKSYKGCVEGNVNFSVDHDLSCVEVVLASIVVFLSYCSELLLLVPEVLSQISIMLEELLASFSPEGRFGKESTNPAAMTRLRSARASLMEAFAWLPSGSFPMAADAVFAFAGQQIQGGIAGRVTCSILPSLVTREDLLLDARSFSRVDRAGQVGGATEIEETIIILTSEVVHHCDRESVLHFQGCRDFQEGDKEFRNSEILAMLASDVIPSPPTPLHAAVGTWRKPFDVSCSSTVRLLDSAIQAFSTTFGLKGGMEQQEAMEMLESLIPPFSTQLANAIGVNTSLSEPATRTKAKEDSAAVSDITAVLLACLKALPLHEATHNVPIGLGPPWMNKAKDLLLTLLPSGSNVVRRAGAEGLALLATLGVSEDAHFLQSAVLHSLDEVMQGNMPRTSPFSASRAGSLLTLACIQRMTQRVSDTKSGRNKGRALSAEEVLLQAEETLPTLQMMTRLLPSVARQGFRDFFVVQTHALHAYGLLLAYSGKLETGKKLELDELQLLRKGVELVEDNFVASWTAASADFDSGQEDEKLGGEVSFLAVLLRLMTLLVPSLSHIHAEDPGVALRFSIIATLVLECLGSHPVVAIECMAFFEVLSGNQALLSSPQVASTDTTMSACIPFFCESLKPNEPGLFAAPCWMQMSGCLTSTRSHRAVLRAIKVTSRTVMKEDGRKFVPAIFAFLERSCASRCYTGSRPLATTRSSALPAIERLAMEQEACGVLKTLLLVEATNNCSLLRWILFARWLSGNASAVESDVGQVESFGSRGQAVADVVVRANIDAGQDAKRVSARVGQVRWQLKSLSLVFAIVALDEMVQQSECSADFSHFDFKAGEESIQRALLSTSSKASSRLVFHLGGVISMACTSAVAAVDQAELPTVQLGAVLLLSKLIACFREVQDPQQVGAGIMDQYATQIFSSVKHSLGDENRDPEEAYFRRFFGGCEAIQMIIESRLSKDPTALKRILRPTIPSAEELPFFEYGRACPLNTSILCDDPFENKRGLLLIQIGKVWTAGKLLSGGCNPARQLVQDEANLAVSAASIAFDGARLLFWGGASLCGSVIAGDLKSVESEKEQGQTPDGFLFNNILDIDDAVKAGMAKTWSSCGYFALSTLMQKTKAECDGLKRKAYSIWAEKLIPLMLKGLDDCLTAFASPTLKKAKGWCASVDISEVTVNCLRSLRVLVEDDNEVDNVDQLLQRLRDTVLLPALGRKTSSREPGEYSYGDDGRGFIALVESRQASVISEICELILQIAVSTTETSRALLLSILMPLDLLHQRAIGCTTNQMDLIVSTCLVAAGVLVANCKVEAAFVRSMSQLALAVQVSERSISDRISKEARNLLLVCVSHQAVQGEDKRVIAYQLARTGEWETWCSVCATDEGFAASGSMDVLKFALLDSLNPDQQLEALCALRRLLQSRGDAFVGMAMSEVGAEVLHILKMYGARTAVSLASRRDLCTEATKVAMMAFQHLVSDLVHHQMLVAFLRVTFEYMLLVLRFNGLPNQPTPQAQSDTALGRMVAQAIVRIARTGPAPFRAALLGMTGADRAVLELAMRAEMTGYTTEAKSAPTKRKLNLRGFKK